MTPTPFTVTRSLEIAAPARAIYPLVEDFRRWTQWSPWEDADPNMERTYEGAATGVGSIYRWSGNRKAGAGSMTITDTDQPWSVTIALEFSKPMRARNTTLFTLSEDEPSGVTVVEWTMSGESAGLAKLFTRFVPMDSLVGRDFEEGLRRLGSAVTSAR